MSPSQFYNLKNLRWFEIICSSETWSPISSSVVPGSLQVWFPPWSCSLQRRDRFFATTIPWSIVDVHVVQELHIPSGNVLKVFIYILLFEALGRLFASIWEQQGLQFLAVLKCYLLGTPQSSSPHSWAGEWALDHIDVFRLLSCRTYMWSLLILFRARKFLSIHSRDPHGALLWLKRDKDRYFSRTIKDLTPLPNRKICSVTWKQEKLIWARFEPITFNSLIQTVSQIANSFILFLCPNLGSLALI